MTKTEMKTTTYRVADWLIDIVDNGKLWESWLYNEKYGIKSYMFGVFKKDCNTIEDYIEMVEWNLLEYINSYMAEYFDGDDAAIKNEEENT